MVDWLTYLIIINGVMVFIMAIDKHRAIHHKSRIPEITLWLLALIGGSYGLLVAIHGFNHKIKKLHFKYGVYGLILVHSCLLLVLHS